ncbi:unnamed protein product [Bursaphelenchus okinawaensis]|uniref:CCR4-NOT transcription complex subunit 1 domain-containing protein n=1 Tax=Bursaphelenchus okinawaensis TaxID=465554 RepID=A0A811KNF9_9BILA|nr:unnamed protein product [Bursaphelenchus okinawaensis]CAG9106753.1 unnamed protein product [Bursaphelenchus okinawaensis]
MEINKLFEVLKIRKEEIDASAIYRQLRPTASEGSKVQETESPDLIKEIDTALANYQASTHYQAVIKDAVVKATQDNLLESVNRAVDPSVSKAIYLINKDHAIDQLKPEAIKMMEELITSFTPMICRKAVEEDIESELRSLMKDKSLLKFSLDQFVEDATAVTTKVSVAYIAKMAIKEGTKVMYPHFK